MTRGLATAAGVHGRDRDLNSESASNLRLTAATMAFCGGKATAGVAFFQRCPPGIIGLFVPNGKCLTGRYKTPYDDPMEGQIQQAWLSLIVGVGCLWTLRRGWNSLGGTTLRAAWCWAILSIAVITVVEAMLGFSHSLGAPQSESMRFASAALLFCPTMALFGAKRPQNGAWQFVVVTLWAILVLPAIEVWLRGRGELLEIHVVRSWFMVVLIVAGAVNHLPTRFAPPALCLAAAQTVLLWPQLPFGDVYELRTAAAVALMLLLAGAVLARRLATTPGRSKIPSSNAAAELRDWSIVWRDFHDWFGLVWSVRVVERVNASAAMYGWPVTLAWDGFVAAEQAASAGSADSKEPQPPSASSVTSYVTLEQRPAIEAALRSLLRRFVAPEWIDRRLAAASNKSAKASAG